MGNAVVVAGYLSTTGAGTHVLGTLPAGCRPPSYTAAPTASRGYAEIGQDGVLKVTAKESGANYFTLCYPVV